jgi:hypothetical protein
MMGTRLQHTLFTSPWRGEVGSRSEPGGGDFFLLFTPPRSRLARSTLPLQGRVGARRGGYA